MNSIAQLAHILRRCVREGFSHAAREVCFPSGLHPPYTYITVGTIRRSFTYGG